MKRKPLNIPFVKGIINHEILKKQEEKKKEAWVLYCYSLTPVQTCFLRLSDHSKPVHNGIAMQQLEPAAHPCNSSEYLVSPLSHELLHVPLIDLHMLPSGVETAVAACGTALG